MSLPKICTCPTAPAADCPFHHQDACGSLAAAACSPSEEVDTAPEQWRSQCLVARIQRDQAITALEAIETHYVDGDDTHEAWRAMGDIAANFLSANAKVPLVGDGISKLTNVLNALDAAIPEGEGAVSLRLFADGGGRFELEMWGAPVASGTLGEELVTDHGLVIGANPDWLPDVEALVARLNSILANAESTHPESKP